MARDRHVQLSLTVEQMRFLEQEKRRIKKAYGIKTSVADIIRALVEQHTMRMTQLATAEPESVEWFYRYLAEENDDKRV
jgi:hypothetical protein